MEIPVTFQLPANPSAYIGNSFSLYKQVNYHFLVNYPQRLKEFPIQAEGFSGSWDDIGISITLYSFVHIDIYSVTVHKEWRFKAKFFVESRYLFFKLRLGRLIFNMMLLLPQQRFCYCKNVGMGWQLLPQQRSCNLCQYCHILRSLLD